jgi:ligand-binding SRPBCC domain-containing protein
VKHYGCRVVTTTISRRQYEYARQIFQSIPQGERIELLLEDYRLLRGQYDKIVSIEMFEAVGLRYYNTFFSACDRLLRPDGAMLMQTITINERAFPAYHRSSDWIQKYIFPGSELASVSEIHCSLARATSLGLYHAEDIGTHYARGASGFRMPSTRSANWGLTTVSFACGTITWPTVRALFWSATSATSAAADQESQSEASVPGTVARRSCRTGVGPGSRPVSRFHTLRREQWIPRPLEEVFAFFSDARNLERITPSWLGFQILTPGPIRIAAGTSPRYRLRVHDFPLRWTTEIRRWEPPHRFIDVQLSGPYQLWHHTHRFEADNGGTRMTDVVRYRLPFGMIGRIVRALKVRHDVEQIFDYRRAQIDKLFATP